MESTLALFRRLYNNLPPLFPDNLKHEMNEAIEHVSRDESVTLTAIEDAMITWGYEVWPWNKAYQEFLAAAEAAVGEKFFLPKLPAELQAKYHDFKAYGGNLRELHSGRPADYFTSDDRTRLCVALVELQFDLRRYVEQELKGLSQQKYLAKVVEFETVLEEIKGHLQRLHELADKETDHPMLVDEIRARVRAFEEGLCLLAPEMSHEAVCQSIDFFHGRKAELTRLRGIHEPLEMDFYN